MLRAAQLYIIKTARVNKNMLLKLGEWVNRAISILVLLLLTLPVPPNSIFKGI